MRRRKRSRWADDPREGEIVSLHLDSNLLFEELARTVYDTVVLVPGIHTIRVSTESPTTFVALTLAYTESPQFRL